ncbi:MAG: STAS domain-containing protein [Rhodobacteraceae bacterium]|nr:STAS domain-containing protein [Paracoccaceae bacterium]
MGNETAQAAAPASGTSSTFHLESRLTVQHAPALLDSLRMRRGGDLTLDASSVVTISTPCMQVLLAAGESWRRDGRRLQIMDPSSDFLMDLEHLGIGLEALQSQEST